MAAEVMSDLRALFTREPSQWPAARIQALRKQHGWTQWDLASMAGVNRASVAHWETSTPDGPERESIRRMLDIVEITHAPTPAQTTASVVPVASGWLK